MTDGPEGAAGVTDVPRLLRWLRAKEPGTVVVLVCSGAPEPRAHHGELVIAWPGCLRDASVGLPSQLLAECAARVEAVLCAAHGTSSPGAASHGAAAAARDGAAPQTGGPPQTGAPAPVRGEPLATWRALTPGLVSEHSPTRGLRRGEHLDASAVPLPRRALVGALGTGPLDLDADDQARTLAALDVLAADGRIPDPAVVLAGLPARGRRLLVSGCTMCAACTHACPEGALAIVEGSEAGSARGLVHDPARCRSCGACLAACPVGALAPGDAISLAEARSGGSELLAASATSICAHCGNPFPEDGTATCPVCTAQARAPLSSEIPPEAAGQLPPEVLAVIRRSRHLD